MVVCSLHMDVKADKGQSISLPQPSVTPPQQPRKPGTDRRSRTGCVECRRIRRKCDETRPHCLACVGAGKKCSYNQPLRWGGRPFKKSSFGQQLGAGVGIIVQEGSARNTKHSHRTGASPAFVYGPVSGSAPPIKQETSPSSSGTTTRAVTPAKRNGPLLSRDTADQKAIDEEIVRHVLNYTHPPAAINWLNWLSPQHRFLVHHFMTKFSKSFSLHPHMHERFCSTLIPFALDKSHGIHLLAAMLVAAARHRKALGNPIDDARVDKLATISLGHLARQPIGKHAKINQVAAATALVLCMAEIQAGGEKPGTWVVHLQGAKAILTSSEAMEGEHEAPSSTLRLLRRWCQSLDIVSMSASGAPHRANPNISGQDAMQMPSHIDMFEGFSVSLIPIFVRMSELAHSRATITELEEESGPTDVTKQMRQSMVDRGRVLDSQIGELSTQLRAVLDLSRVPLPGPCTDYQNLNEAYHCAARLEIRHNTLTLPMSDPESGEIVKRGIAALRRMKVEGAAPSSKTLHVAFSLGCASGHSEDRAFIIEWIDHLYREFGMLNTQHAKAILADHWHRLDNRLPWIRPRQLAQMRGWDLILY